LATAQLSKGDASGDVISKIENLIGSGFNDVLKGNDFNSLLFASGKNVLDGGAGNDKLTGGNQSDTFAFSTGDDKDTVTDFSATGGDHDVIDLSGLKSITDFSDLTAHHLSQAANGDAIINGLGGDTLTLKHVDIGNLDSGDFHF
jgi:Ca2+-binding RTX toxin-like protein